MPPTLSLWPFRNFVVLWTTRSAPKSIGRWTYGLANVLSTTTTTSRACAISQAAVRSVSRSVGLVGVSRNSIRVAGRIAFSIASSFDVVHVGEVELILPQHPLEQSIGAAVCVVGDDDVIARLEERHDGALGGHA